MKRKTPSKPAVPYTIKTRSQTEAESRSPEPANTQDIRGSLDSLQPEKKNSRVNKKKLPKDKSNKTSNIMSEEKEKAADSTKPIEKDEEMFEENSAPALTTTASTTAANTALQGLMRRLGGAALEELLPPPGGGQPPLSLSTLVEGRSKLKILLQGLKSDNESQQLESMMELCDYLSMGTEESLAGFSIDSFVPAIVNLLNMEHNPDLMLLACRSLSHLLEALPSAGSSIVLSGAVPSLCSKLLSIEYIDLAEQSLQALEKLSLEHPASVLRAGGLMAVLSYLDFFPTGVQRVAVSTAANICRQVPIECFDTVADAVPMLANLLQYSDQKVVESTIVCFSRLIDSFCDYENKLQIITSHGLLPHMVRLISSANTNVVISPGTYTLVVHLLATLCQGAPAVSYILMQEGIVPTLQNALTGATGTSALSRPAQQIFELLSLINELLPPLPTEIANLMAATGKAASGFGQRERIKKTRKPEDITPRSEKTEPEADPREKMLVEHPDLLVRFGKSLFVVLVDMFTSTVNPSVRYKCLSAITKILFFETEDMLKDLLESFAFSSFVAGLLASRDNAIVAVALKMSEVMMEKLPTIFSRYFRREGVVYEVERLTKLEPLNFAPVPVNSNPVPSSSISKPAAIAPLSVLDSPSRSAQHATTAASPSSPSPSSSDYSIPIPTTPHTNVPPPLSSSPSSSSFFFVGSPASVQTTTTTTATTHDDMKTYVCTQAKIFHEKYFKRSLGDSADSSSTEQLLRLQKVSTLLGKDLEGNDYTEASLLSEIANMLTTPEGVSTFEFLRSNLSENLLAYLTKSGIDDDDGDSNGCLARALNFILTFMGLPGIAALTNSSIPLVSSAATTKTTNDNATGATTTTMHSTSQSGKPAVLPVSVIVNKLHDSLNKLERFPVLINDTPGTASGLKYLTQPFKLKLQKDGEYEMIKDYSANVVLVEPLATVGAIEDFLLPKIKRDASDIPRGEEREKDRTKEREKEIDRSQEKAEDRKKGGKKKFERKKEEDKKDAAKEKSKITKEDKPVEGGSSVSGSEDMDLYEEDDDYDNYDDDDDDDDEVLPSRPGDRPESPDRVYDLKLDSTGTTPPVHKYLSSTPTRPLFSSSPLSHTARSLLSSLPPATPPTVSFPSPSASPSTSLTTPPPTPMPSHSLPAFSNFKLAFYVHDQRLPGTTTIFQAVQRLTRDLTNPDTPQPVHRMWEAVHTLKYRLVPIDSTEGTGITEVDTTSIIKDPNGGVEPLDCASLLQFLQDDHTFNVATSDTTYEILALLRVINQFNLNWPTLYHKGFLRPVLSQTDLINNRLTAKLMRQLQDPLTICSGALPAWCKQLVVACPFLFPFECRRQYFNSTCFGIARALQSLQQRNEGLRASGDRAEFRIGRIQRQKVRISRSRLLESAVKVMDLYGKNKAILEVEYFGEVGTGLGPTLEFFTLVSREIQKKGLGIWWDESSSSSTNPPVSQPTPSTPTPSQPPTHTTSSPIAIPRPDASFKPIPVFPKSSPITTTTTTTTTAMSTITTTNVNFDDDDDADYESATAGMDIDQRGSATHANAPPSANPTQVEFVFSPGGLFPTPLKSGSPDYERKVELFKFLGTFLAKSFLDARLLDLPLSAPFLKWITGQDLRFEDLHTVSPALGKSLEGLVGLCREKRTLERKLGTATPPEQKFKQIEALRYRGATVEDLCLDFTLPGRPEWDLKSGGSDIPVTIHNLEEYVNLVTKTYLITGVRAQIQAFQEGFNLVFPLENLRMFSVGELETLICGAVTGSEEDWLIESLQDNTKADHGFSTGSQAVQFLYSVMAEFNETERRQFLQFVTGSPRLPISGFRGLTPKLTIVRKHHDPPLTPDHYLPSVMSCTNYLKLPDYSSKEILKQRLLYAIIEGHSSFHLS